MIMYAILLSLSFSSYADWAPHADYESNAAPMSFDDGLAHIAELQAARNTRHNLNVTGDARKPFTDTDAERVWRLAAPTKPWTYQRLLDETEPLPRCDRHVRDAPKIKIEYGLR